MLKYRYIFIYILLINISLSQKIDTVITIWTDTVGVSYKDTLIIDTTNYYLYGPFNSAKPATNSFLYLTPSYPNRNTPLWENSIYNWQGDVWPYQSSPPYYNGHSLYTDSIMTEYYNQLIGTLPDEFLSSSYWIGVPKINKLRAVRSGSSTTISNWAYSFFPHYKFPMYRNGDSVGIRLPELLFIKGINDSSVFVDARLDSNTLTLFRKWHKHTQGLLTDTLRLDTITITFTDSNTVINYYYPDTTIYRDTTIHSKVRTVGLIPIRVDTSTVPDIKDTVKLNYKDPLYVDNDTLTCAFPPIDTTTRTPTNVCIDVSYSAGKTCIVDPLSPHSLFWPLNSGNYTNYGTFLVDKPYNKITVSTTLQKASFDLIDYPTYSFTDTPPDGKVYLVVAFISPLTGAVSELIQQPITIPGQWYADASDIVQPKQYVPIIQTIDITTNYTGQYWTKPFLLVGDGTATEYDEPIGTGYYLPVDIYYRTGSSDSKFIDITNGIFTYCYDSTGYINIPGSTIDAGMEIHGMRGQWHNDFGINDSLFASRVSKVGNKLIVITKRKSFEKGMMYETLQVDSFSVTNPDSLNKRIDTLYSYVYDTLYHYVFDTLIVRMDSIKYKHDITDTLWHIFPDVAVDKILLSNDKEGSWLSAPYNSRYQFLGHDGTGNISWYDIIQLIDTTWLHIQDSLINHRIDTLNLSHEINGDLHIGFPLKLGKGGTGKTIYTLGDLLYYSGNSDSLSPISIESTYNNYTLTAYCDSTGLKYPYWKQTPGSQIIIMNDTTYTDTVLSINCNEVDYKPIEIQSSFFGRSTYYYYSCGMWETYQPNFDGKIVRYKIYGQMKCTNYFPTYEHNGITEFYIYDTQNCEFVYAYANVFSLSEVWSSYDETIEIPKAIRDSAKLAPTRYKYCLPTRKAIFTDDDNQKCDLEHDIPCETWSTRDQLIVECKEIDSLVEHVSSPAYGYPTSITFTREDSIITLDMSRYGMKPLSASFIDIAGVGTDSDIYVPDVIGLQDSLQALRDLYNLFSGELSTKSDTGHTHEITEINYLQDTLQVLRDSINAKGTGDTYVHPTYISGNVYIDTTTYVFDNGHLDSVLNGQILFDNYITALSSSRDGNNVTVTGTRSNGLSDVSTIFSVATTGYSGTQDIVTDVRLYEGATQKKTKTLTFVNGVVTNISAESDWQ